MVVGFNHNVQYKGEVFHIQTEDSGINNPHIITLLYRGGTILASKKTSYADIIKIESLDQVVEELMKEQHKEMLRNLKAGQYDDRAFGVRAAVPSTPAVTQDKPAATPQPAEQPPSREVVRPVQSLDEVILDYLVRGED
jgi:hypothetical protein